MGKFIKNRFFIVMVSLTIALVVLPLILSAFQLPTPLRSVVNVLVTPVQKLAQSISGAAAGFRSYFTDFDKMVEENTALKQQLAELREQMENADEINALNDWLYSYLDLKREHSDFQFLDAAITGRSSTNYAKIFTLDKGSSSGVAVNMPVLTNDGIIGYVFEVGRNWCKVKSLLDYDSAIGVKDKRSGALGVAEASYELSKEGKLRLSYLTADADIRIGDCIISSGFSELYPENLIIGYIETIEDDNFSRSKVATISMAASLENASRVMILVGYDQES